MRGATAPVGDREHLVWREETERADRDRDSESDAQNDVIHPIDAQVQTGQAEHGNNHCCGRFRIGAGPARHDQAVGDAYEDDREDSQLERRRRITSPAPGDPHAVRARPRQLLVEPGPGKLEEAQAAQEHN